MQQANRALSAPDACASSEITADNSATRRGVLAAFAIVPAIVATPALAAPGWNPWEWIDRWHRLGCGVRLDGHGNIQFTPRRGAEGEASAILAEVNSADRTAGLRAALDRNQQLLGGCAAMRQVVRIEQIDREFISEADDPAGNAAWLERWAEAYEKLERIPASTGRGLAAKLRQGLDGNGAIEGDRIIAAALRQLERWA